MEVEARGKQLHETSLILRSDNHAHKKIKAIALTTYPALQSLHSRTPFNYYSFFIYKQLIGFAAGQMHAPSTEMVCPLTNEAASDAKYINALMTSSGWH